MRTQKLDLSPVPPLRHMEQDDDVVLTSSIPSMDLSRASHAAAAGAASVSALSVASSGGFYEDMDPSSASVAARSVYAESEGGLEEEDRDIATARPSHRRLAEFTPGARSWDQGHRIEVFLRIR